MQITKQGPGRLTDLENPSYMTEVEGVILSDCVLVLQYFEGLGSESHPVQEPLGSE